MTGHRTIARQVCPHCGHPCINEHGYRSHWAQAHWAPEARRLMPLDAVLTQAEVVELAANSWRYRRNGSRPRPARRRAP